MGWKRATFDSEREYEEEDRNMVFGTDGMCNFDDELDMPFTPTPYRFVTCPCGTTLHPGPQRYELTGEFTSVRHTCHFI